MEKGYRKPPVLAIEDLGLDEYLYGSGVCVVEWAEKWPELLSSEHLLIELDSLDDTQRSFHLKYSGKRYQELLASLKHSLLELKKE